MSSASGLVSAVVEFWLSSFVTMTTWHFVVLDTFPFQYDKWIHSQCLVQSHVKIFQLIHPGIINMLAPTIGLKHCMHLVLEEGNLAGYIHKQ